ncbi:MAG: archaeal proteasome endopeptidase complex subunit beta [Candidatus Micrarchaeota archaeon]|nr:archaeal proteasome endopeptidase complex subunit beta [Candidatus Micrarchaeota archaeon]
MAETALKTGTTTVGIIFRDGVVLASDKQATLGYMVESKKAKKIYRLDDHIGISVAGLVGDIHSMVRLLRAHFKLYKLERGPISVRAAATLVSNVLHGSKFFPYLVQIILGGFDGKPGLYAFDPYGGTSEEDKFYSTGSGSPFAYGVLESGYRENLTRDEAVKLAVKAVKTAMERDTGSGFGVTVAVIDKNGYREIQN